MDRGNGSTRPCDCVAGLVEKAAEACAEGRKAGEGMTDERATECANRVLMLINHHQAHVGEIAEIIASTLASEREPLEERIAELEAENARLAKE